MWLIQETKGPDLPFAGQVSFLMEIGDDGRTFKWNTEREYGFPFANKGIALLCCETIHRRWKDSKHEVVPLEDDKG